MHGAFRLVVYRDKLSDATHLALVRGPVSPDTETLVRVHEPLSVMDLLDTGHTSHSWSIAAALAAIARAGRGVVVLLHRPESAQELRRRALAAEAPAPAKVDLRNYGIGAQILRDLNVGKMRLLAKPRKMPSMAGFDLEVTGYVEQPARERVVACFPASCSCGRHTHDPPHPREHERRSAAASASCCRASIPGIGELMLAGALRAIKEAGVVDRNVTVATVPGALETPLALQRFAQTGDYDALVALGAVIRGETYHFEIVANESARGVAEVQLEFGIPIGNGILTTDTDEQALVRARRKGSRRRRRRSSSPICSKRSMANSGSARHRARGCVLQGLYERAALGQRCRRDSRELVADASFANADRAYFDELWSGVNAESDALMRMIEAAHRPARRAALADRARHPRDRRVGARAPPRDSLPRRHRRSDRAREVVRRHRRAQVRQRRARQAGARPCARPRSTRCPAARARGEQRASPIIRA